MENPEVKSNSNIYKILGIKSPKKYHLKLSKEKISEALRLIDEAKNNLRSTPFQNNKSSNKKVVTELVKQLDTVLWNLVFLNEGISRLSNLRQTPGWIHQNEYNRLLQDLVDPENLI